MTGESKKNKYLQDNRLEAFEGKRRTRNKLEESRQSKCDMQYQRVDILYKSCCEIKQMFC